MFWCLIIVKTLDKRIEVKLMLEVTTERGTRLNFPWMHTHPTVGNCTTAHSCIGALDAETPYCGHLDGTIPRYPMEPDLLPLVLDLRTCSAKHAEGTAERE